LVNGWTDAPNAIATAVSTRALSVRAAIIMASFMNFLGVFVMTMINATVAQTIFNMVDFGPDAQASIVGLCAAMFAIVVWATAASMLGIPTSESHALIAGLSGAAIALHNSFAGINGAEWAKVLYGLLLSSVMGFLSGFLTSRLLTWVFANRDRRNLAQGFRRAQIWAAAGMAFMHGAQDGQKFMAVFLIGIFLNRGDTSSQTFLVPLWMMVISSLVMALGTSIGGYRIIKSVGMDMVKLEPYQGFAADLAASASLMTAQLLGLPVSTTHTKTTAIIGVGASSRLSSVKWSIVGDMVLSWVLTFPGCGLIGYGMTKLFTAIF
ncbi:MAG TPA: inorganic phosphate transporter, partial [Clostridia bacterium]|nr:inorganic phosphate transporter [Clostridia bacterium]